MGSWSEADTVSSIPRRFAWQAARRPDHLAIAGTGQPLTYSALDQLAARYAQLLLERASAAGHVGLLFDHGAPVVAAALGALRHGCAVVTLNPSDPPARLAQVRIAAGIELLMTDDPHLVQARAAGFDEGEIRILAPEIAIASDRWSAAVVPDDLAVLISTSGSTGRPKAVMQTHRNVLHNVLRYTNGLSLDEDDRVAWLASLSGGQGLATTWSTLLNGATLCPFPIMERGVTGLADWLGEHRITVFDTLPSVLRNFSRTLGDQRLEGVRLVRLASEPALRIDFEAFRRHFASDCLLASVLASSEAGITAQGLFRINDEPPDGRLSVGTAAEGIEIVLVGDDGTPVADGETGEIELRGRYLSPGYWGDEALTAERFQSTDGQRRFRSGDLARRSLGGSLTIAGRADAQVKVRGHRLQLEEVEDVLSRQPGVAGAAVAVRTNERGDTRLSAFLTVAPGRSLDLIRLRGALAGVLPPHAVPTEFACVDAFPLTAHGKVDREQLARLERALPTARPLGRPPSETEELLLDIWRFAFEHDEVGLDDGFLALGGDSLTAVVIAAGVHELFGVALALSPFTTDPTVTTLAALIDTRRGSATDIDDEPPLVRVARTGIVPLSFSQQAMWVSVRDKGAGFNLAVPYRIRGPLDADVLADSVQQIVRRHEILRTTFLERDGQPIQVVGPQAPLELPIDDLREEADPRARAAELVACAANTPFDVGARPPLSLRLLRVADDEHQLLLVSHHLICDALSWRVFFDELAVVYEACMTRRPSPLSREAPLQYADYTLWERACLRPGSPRYERDLAWWQAMFESGPAALELPFERTESDNPVPQPDGIIKWGLAPELSQQLDRIGLERGATYFMTRLAAFAALAALETGADDFVLDTYATNRRRAELQRMLGPLMNRTLLRLRFSAEHSFGGWLEAVRGAVLDMSRHATIPFRPLRAELLRRGVAFPPVRTKFEAHYAIAPLSFGGLELNPLLRHYVEPYGFTLGVDRRYESERCRAVFDPRQYDPAGAERFLGRLEGLVAAICAEPNRPLDELHGRGVRGER